MNGFQLTFFTEQDRRHGGETVVEWLVKLTRELKLPGVTVIPASEGMGHHHRLHSARFFELADQPVSIVMIVTGDEADRLFDRLRQEKVRLFFTKVAIEFGMLGETQG
jgi:PII-like signaling protein